MAEIEQWAWKSPVEQAGIWEDLPMRMKRMKSPLNETLRNFLDRNHSA